MKTAVMNPFEARALRDRSVAKTIERLRWDRERSSHRIAPLVAYIEERLFEPDLTYERIRAACRIRDNNRTTNFRRELGLTPAAYVRDCRMEVASRLLRDTNLEVSWIAELVGYGGPQVFTPAFKRYAGVTPTWYRRRDRPSVAAEPPPAGSIPDLNPSAWRRFVTGELASEEAALLLRHFLDRYPDVRRQLVAQLLSRFRQGDELPEATDGDGELLPSLRELLAPDDVESLMAELVWDRIRGRPRYEQIDVVRRHLCFSTPALFRLLGEKSLQQGRVDPEGGVRIAQLALKHAAALDDGEPEDGTSRWKAVAWTWIGHAKRLALDERGAARAFEAAERRLPKGGHAELASIRAELAERAARAQGTTPER